MAAINVPGAIVFDGQQVKFVLASGAGEIDLTEVSVIEPVRQKLLGIMAIGFRELTEQMKPDPQPTPASTEQTLRDINQESNRLAEEAERLFAESSKRVQDAADRIKSAG